MAYLYGSSSQIWLKINAVYSVFDWISPSWSSCMANSSCAMGGSYCRLCGRGLFCNKNFSFSSSPEWGRIWSNHVSFIPLAPRLASWKLGILTTCMPSWLLGKRCTGTGGVLIETHLFTGTVLVTTAAWAPAAVCMSEYRYQSLPAQPAENTEFYIANAPILAVLTAFRKAMVNLRKGLVFFGGVGTQEQCQVAGSRESVRNMSDVIWSVLFQMEIE